jgi:hypothetical protein
MLPVCLAAGSISDAAASHRAALTSTKENCLKFVADLYPSAASGAQSFSSGGFAPDYEEDSQTCDEGSILGVQSDVGSCGFSGNDKVAEAYCADFEDAPCCADLVTEEAGSAQSLTSGPTTGDATAPNNTSGKSTFGSAIGAIAGVIVCVAAIVGGAVVVRRRRRHSHSRVGGEKKSGILGMTASPSSSAGSSPAKSPPDLDSPRYVVIHEYAQTLPDELELRRGDIVTVGSSFDDSWYVVD